MIRTLFLAACLHAQAAPVANVMLQPSDRLVPQSVYAAQIQPIKAKGDIAAFVAQQAALGGPVILWLGDRHDPAAVVQRYPAIIAEARKHPNIKHVYLYDELFWHNGTFAFGLHEREVLEGARLARQAGLQPLVTILPDVILHPTFALDVNAFDGIAIDVYPSIRPTVPDLGGCRSGINATADLFYCAAQKLRAMGFVGQLGYIYQAFGLAHQSESSLKHQLLEQRAAIDAAADMGASAVMPWGMWLGADELAAEPYLVPLGGTKLERLVRP